MLLAGCHYSVQDISQCRTSLFSVLLFICFPPMMLCCCPDGQLSWRQLSCWWFPFPDPFLEHFGRRDTLLQNLTGKILPNANSASFHMSILLFQIRALLSSNSIFTWCFIYSFCFLSPRPPPPSASKFRRTSSTGEMPLFGEVLEILQHIKE